MWIYNAGQMVKPAKFFNLVGARAVDFADELGRRAETSRTAVRWTNRNFAGQFFLCPRT